MTVSAIGCPVRVLQAALAHGGPFAEVGGVAAQHPRRRDRLRSLGAWLVWRRLLADGHDRPCSHLHRMLGPGADLLRQDRDGAVIALPQERHPGLVESDRSRPVPLVNLGCKVSRAPPVLPVPPVRPERMGPMAPASCRRHCPVVTPTALTAAAPSSGKAPPRMPAMETTAHLSHPEPPGRRVLPDRPASQEPEVTTRPWPPLHPSPMASTHLPIAACAQSVTSQRSGGQHRRPSEYSQRRPKQLELVHRRELRHRHLRNPIGLAPIRGEPLGRQPQRLRVCNLPEVSASQGTHCRDSSCRQRPSARKVAEERKCRHVRQGMGKDR